MSGPPKGLPALSAVALAEATGALLLAAAVNRCEVPPPRAQHLARAAIRAYLNAHKGAGRAHALGAATLRMATMRVGEKALLPADVAAETWRGRIKAARRHTMNPRLSFKIKDVLGGVWVTRLPDGTHANAGSRRTARYLRLVAMELNEIILTDWPKLYHYDRQLARAAIGQHVKFTSRRWSDGLRVKRVA